MLVFIGSLIVDAVNSPDLREALIITALVDSTLTGTIAQFIFQTLAVFAWARLYPTQLGFFYVGCLLCVVSPSGEEPGPGKHTFP